MTDPQRLGPPPIEPLSDAAWSHIERGLWSRMDAPGACSAVAAPAPSRRWRIIAGPLVLAAVIAAIVITTRDSERAGRVPGEPSRIVSGAAPAAVAFGDVYIELDAATALVTAQEAAHPSVVLEHGAAWFTVAPRERRPAFLVRAGDATIRVVGTRFRVARSAGRSVVEVEHGLVEVQRRGRLTSVGANQRWSSDSPEQVASIAAPALPTPATIPAAPVAPTPVAPAASAPAAPTRAPAPDRPERPVPTSASPAPASITKPASRPAASNTSTPAATTIDPDRAEYDRLAALEPASPDAALSGYLALARRTSAWADPALFAAARLAADRGDHRAGALLEMYLARFPRGANATDARQLRARQSLIP